MKKTTKMPSQYTNLKKKFKHYMDAVDNLGKAVKEAGPIDEKTAHLIQLSAAASKWSEGSVHSHTRRALAAGAKPAEIYQALMLITSISGFPTVSAALSWADDVILKKKAKKK
ncbi:MAG: carboxymuconolactone decarboxylase family protein [Nitrospiraceae bacterium]|nr:carboxymuconolactone decarboxylase family protein [Nitrospiraceae bacterium]